MSPSALPVQDRLYTAEQSRAVDAAARTALGISGCGLMQRAALAAFNTLQQVYPRVGAITVWCGKGNNGGDALLLAGLARDAGLAVQCCCVARLDELQGDAALAYAHVVAQGLTIEFTREPASIALAGEVIVDGLLGTGISGLPREPYAAAISHLRDSRLPVFSVDVPSGVDATTGSAELALPAQHTVTFITRKLGLATGAGRGYAGEVSFADLGVPLSVYPPPRATELRWAADSLPELTADTYKHRQGQVLVVGGDVGMPGSVLLAASAALRVGAGLVTLATQPRHASAIIARRPELMLVDAASDELAEQLTRADLVVLGPGLGRNAWGQAAYQAVETSGKPVVLDADGLYWLARSGQWRGGALYLTPHAGEAARLLADQSQAADRAGATPVPVRSDDRIAIAEALRQRYAATVVLKGPGSVVASPHGVQICAHGNPGMASAGMGDVLAGVAGGLLAPLARQHTGTPPAGSSGPAGPVAPESAQHDAQATAFAAAVALHSAAADVAALAVGQRSLLAADVIDALPQVLHR